MSAEILAELLNPREVAALRSIEAMCRHRFQPLIRTYVYPGVAITLKRLKLIKLRINQDGVRLVKITRLGSAVLAASDSVANPG